MKKGLLALAAVIVFAGCASAAATPFKLSLWGKKIALPPIENVHGVEVGVASYSPEVRGIQYNVLLSKSDDMIGVQGAIVTRSNKFLGIQMGFINLSSHDGDFGGVQFGLINRAKSFTGLQMAILFNKAADEMNGVQLGLINSATNFKGLQLGLVNTAANAKGVQLGLINIMRNSYVPFMVILNAKFKI
jgi:hypothetical protein